MRLALTLAVLSTAISSAAAQDAGSRDATAYRVTGFRLRAAYVCPGNKQAMTDHAFAPVASPEFKAFSQAYPQTIQKWMAKALVHSMTR